MMKRLRLGAACGAWSLLAVTAAGNAAGPYGTFTPPATSGSPAGFQSNVRLATTIRVSGGKLSAPVLRGAHVTVTVSAHTFTRPVQVSITQPSSSALGSLLQSLGFKRYTLATGFSVTITRTNGKAVTGRFSKPVSIKIRGPAIGVKGEKVLRVVASRSATKIGRAHV